MRRVHYPHAGRTVAAWAWSAATSRAKPVGAVVGAAERDGQTGTCVTTAEAVASSVQVVAVLEVAERVGDWPRSGSYTAASGQDLMAADTRFTVAADGAARLPRRAQVRSDVSEINAIATEMEHPMSIATAVIGRFRGWNRARSRSAARDELIRRLPRGGTGAEIGVWRGDFTARLLAGAQPAVLHLIDPWAFQPEFDRSWFGGSVAKSQEDMDAVYEGVERRFASEITSNRIQIHRAQSVEAASEFASGHFDWVYVDGNHEYEYVLADLRAYTPLVRPGGYVVGDDYGSSGWWKGGVTKAVDEWAASSECELNAVLADQFILRRPESFGS